MNRPSIEQQVLFLHCDNLEETAQFYEKTLQLPLVLDQGSCRIYQISTTAFIGFCVTLGAHLNGSERSGVIITLVSNEVDAWHQYLVEQGVEIEKPPTLYEEFNIYHCFFRDPNGYLIEVQTFLDKSWPQINRTGIG